jgi:hypothetical protein
MFLDFERLKGGLLVLRSSPAGSEAGCGDMTEVEFVSRFQREATGSWTCTKPIKIDGPSGPLFINQGHSFSPGTLFLGIDLARELDRMAAIQRAASKLSGGAFATAA